MHVQKLKVLLPCHCEPFASCHCEVAEGNRSNLRWAQGKLREAISNGSSGLLRSLCSLAMTNTEATRNRSIPRNYTSFIAFALVLIVAILMCLPPNLWAHEIVGEVTPLMIHMKRALLLIENGRDKEALHEIHRVYEDFSHDMGMGMVMEGIGLKKTVADIDKRYRTELGPALSQALEKGDAEVLKKIVQDLAYLLMLEKLEALHSTFGKQSANLEAQRTMFWLGRNYFSYLLEPDLALKDPVEEQRLDRLLDRMLYRLEDGEVEELLVLQKELMKGLVAAFHLDLVTLMHAGSQRR